MKAIYREIIGSLTQVRTGELSSFDLITLLHEREWSKGNRDPLLGNLRVLLHELRMASLESLPKGKVTRWEKDQIVGFCVVRAAMAFDRSSIELLTDKYFVEQLQQAGFRKISQQSFNATYKPAVRKSLKKIWKIDF